MGKTVREDVCTVFMSRNNSFSCSIIYSSVCYYCMKSALNSVLSRNGRRMVPSRYKEAFFKRSSLNAKSFDISCSILTVNHEYNWNSIGISFIIFMLSIQQFRFSFECHQKAYDFSQIYVDT